MSAGALIRVLRVGLRITTLIFHLTIDSKVAVPMKYTRWERAFVENENQISRDWFTCPPGRG